MFAMNPSSKIDIYFTLEDTNFTKSEVTQPQNQCMYALRRLSCCSLCRMRQSIERQSNQSQRKQSQKQGDGILIAGVL